MVISNIHSSLLELYWIGSILNRIISRPPLDELENGLKYKVTAILDSKMVRNNLYYLVDWLSYIIQAISLGNQQRMFQILEPLLRNFINNTRTN